LSSFDSEVEQEPEVIHVQTEHEPECAPNDFKHGMEFGLTQVTKFMEEAKDIIAKSDFMVFAKGSLSTRLFHGRIYGVFGQGTWK
jgi:hypothetical protein